MGNLFVCHACGSVLAPDDIFCSHCGATVASVVETVGLWKQIWIYFVSIVFPPFGFIWTWKYLRSDNFELKRVGIIATVLTVVAIIVTIWVTLGFFQGMQSQLNAISNFSNLGQ